MAEVQYPKVFVSKSEEEVREMINKNLNTQRAHTIIDRIQNLQNQLVHYKKVYTRWKYLGKLIRIINLSISGTIAGSVGVLAILTTQGVAIPPLILALLGGYSAIETSVMEGFNIGIIKKKKSKYEAKCTLIQDSINKLYFYFEKAREDGVITLDELEGFEKIYNKLENILNNNQSLNDNRLDISILRKEAEEEAKNELAIEMKEKLKHEVKQKLRSTVA